MRATALTVLIEAGDTRADLDKLAYEEFVFGMREIAARRWSHQAPASVALLASDVPGVKAEAIAGATGGNLLPLADLLSSADPFLRHASVQRLSQPARIPCHEESKASRRPETTHWSTPDVACLP